MSQVETSLSDIVTATFALSWFISHPPLQHYKAQWELWPNDSNYFQITFKEKMKKKTLLHRRITCLTTRMVRTAESRTADSHIVVLSELREVLFCLMILERIFFCEFLVVCCCLVLGCWFVGFCLCVLVFPKSVCHMPCLHSKT